MITFLRWLIGVFFIVAVSIFVLILTLPLLYTPNDFKNLITNLVREKTERELVIESGVQVQISPWLDVTCALGKTRLASNASHQNTAWIESEQTKIELSLWSLLIQKRLHMTNIIMDEVTLNLLRNKDGIGNWQLLANPPATVKKDATVPAIPDNIQNLTRLLQYFLPDVSGFDLGKLQLTHINGRYDNRQTNKIIIFSDLQLKTGSIQEKRPFPFEAGCNLTLDDSKTALIRSGNLTIQGNATLFMEEPQLLLEDLQMEGIIKGKNLPKRGFKVLFSGNSEIHLQPQQIVMRDFSLTHDDVSLQGSGTLDDFSSPRFDFSLKIPECSPLPLLKQLKIPLPVWQDAEALSHFNGKMRIKGDMDMAEISDLTIMIDDTTATGTIKIKDPVNPDYEAMILINGLDLDRYALNKTSAPDSEGQETVSAADEEQVKPFPLIIPVNLLKPLLLQLDLQLDSLTVGGAELSKVQMKLAGKDGIIQLAPFTANLYEGSMKLEARLDVTGDIPQLQVKPKINKVECAPLFQDITGKENITGTARLEADLKSSGWNRQEFLSHLNGTMRFELLNSTIQPINILQFIQRADALRRDETPPPMTGDAPTEFSRLNGTAIFENGILLNDDLMATSELMQITGAGKINLIGQQADIMLNVTLTPGVDQKEAMGLTELYGKPIPYRIFGPLANLGQEADVEKILPIKPVEQHMKESPEPAARQESKPEKKEARTPPEPKSRTDAD